MKLTLAFIGLLMVLAIPPVRSQGITALSKPAGDDNTKYTSVGNIAITITNFGTLGHGFRLWPQQPSFQYPRGSGIEHMFIGGIWIGAYHPSNGIRVSTAAVDVSSLRPGAAEGFEFTTGIDSRVVERSTLPDNRFYLPGAVSHQDFVADFTDTNTVNPNQNNEPIPNHAPLGVNVHMETYAFNYAFADNFVILNYWIKNNNFFPLDSVYVALWADIVVRNTIVSPPTGGTSFFNKGGLGYIDSLNVAYGFDFNGDNGLADTYGAMKFLGSTPFRHTTTYQTWQFRNSTDPVFFSPANDADKFTKMSSGLLPSQIAAVTFPINNMTMITAGPYSRIPARDSINVVFALMAAKMVNWSMQDSKNNPDIPENRTNLYLACKWAQRTYDGEDKNGNGIQDSGEVWTGPIIHGEQMPKRFFLPAPPNAPHVKVVPGDQTIDIYWDRNAEASIDPISNVPDFEGYRIYGTNVGFDLTVSQDILAGMNTLGDFDRKDDDIGYNTGFGAIRLAQPVQFPPDTTHYAYKFTMPGVLNGWQYGVAVTAYDSGDASIGLESLESSRLQTLARVFPGTPPSTSTKNPVGVYPNPYYANAYWDGARERLRKLYFRNLPAHAEVRIYTITGDLVDAFTHDAETYTGSEIQWFQTFSDGTQRFAGGEHAWDLISAKDQAIATGLYLFTVKDLSSGETQRGKFLVVK